MNPSLRVLSYEVKESKTGKKVPAINGVNLHSIYNPLVEAEGLVKRFETVLSQKSHILVLGLGFGHHVECILKKLRETRKDHYQVLVIEPNERVFQDSVQINPLVDPRLQLLCKDSINAFYQDKILIDFLLKRPGVIPHAASFNLYNDFFKEFLSYRAPSTISEILENGAPPKAEKFLARLPGNVSLDQLVAQTLERNMVQQEDLFLVLGLNALCTLAAPSQTQQS